MIQKYCLFLFALLAFRAHAVTVSDLFFNCRDVKDCHQFEKYFEEIKGNTYTENQLRRTLDVIGQSLRPYRVSYKIIKNAVNLTFTPPVRLGGIDVVTKGVLDLSSFPLPVEGEEFSENDIAALLSDLRIFLETKGYKNIELNVEKRIENYLIFVKINVDEGRPQKLKKVEIIGDSSRSRLIIPRFKVFEKKIWDKTSFDMELVNIENTYQNEGYYLFRSEIVEIKKYSGDSIVAVVRIDFGPRFGIHISGNNALPRKEMVEGLKVLFSTHGDEVGEARIVQSLHDLYIKKGIYHSQIDVTRRSSQKKRERYYFIKISEGHRFSLDGIRFEGATILGSDKIHQLFTDHGSVLIKRGYYDESSVKNFNDILKKHYLERGYIFAKVLGPQISKDIARKKAAISYRIVEGRKVHWNAINLTGVPDNLRTIALKDINNKKGHTIDLINLKQDIQKIEENLKEGGYFFVQIFNKESPSVVQYTKGYSSADLNLKISLGKVAQFNKAIIKGLDATQEEVVRREFFLKKGEKITPSKIKELKSRISSLRLFNSVSISLQSLPTTNSEQKVDILISVRERKFGYLEFAPGFRSDIGLKFSTTVGYNNLYGKNHSMTLKGQINQRLDYSSFDERRRVKEDKFSEFKTSARYDWPYFLSLPLNMSSLLSFSRRKLRSFDADIARGSFSLSKDWKTWLSTTVRYQIDLNRQFDATDSGDSGSFSVGSVTPGVTFDFRNRSINPSRGAIFNLSAEVVRPYFGSQDDDKDISYNKVVFRNAAYFPLTQNTTLAFSFATGIEKNLAKELPIPKIKVFRLSGVDRVRGFVSNEINRLDIPGEDYPNIDDMDVHDRVYFANFKLESRYQVSDAFVFAPFVDAGRIMLNTYRPFDLRASAGISLKFVTPVGTLNFDYGAKLKRQHYLDGSKRKRDEFGRFHLTLGFF